MLTARFSIPSFLMVLSCRTDTAYTLLRYLLCGIFTNHISYKTELLFITDIYDGEDISSGELLIDGKLVNDVEPKDRDIAMVFQNYALYPHMTVYENMAFALKLRKTPPDEIDRMVREAAKILDLEKLLGRADKNDKFLILNLHVKIFYSFKTIWIFFADVFQRYTCH